MKRNRYTRWMPVLAAALIVALSGIAGAQAVDNEPAKPGPYTLCSYTNDLSDTDYKEAIICYPCEKEDGPFPATTLTGGWTNVYEDMEWLYTHLVTHGYVIIAMTPNNNLGVNRQWKMAHKAGINKLLAENDRFFSPISGLVDTDKLQIMGFSKGGGGALLASSDLGDAVQSTQALAPYIDRINFDLSGITAATVCYTGTDDNIAPPDRVVKMYNSLPDTTERTLGYFNDVNHLGWYGARGDFRDRKKTYITAWMKYYLDGDDSYFPWLYGDIHEDHMDSGWFYDYSHNADASSGGWGCGN